MARDHSDHRGYVLVLLHSPVSYALFACMLINLHSSNVVLLFLHRPFNFFLFLTIHPGFVPVC